MTKYNFIKAIRLYAIKLYTASGFRKAYPYPLHPSYYSPISLQREDGDYIERGLRRDEDIFLIGFHRKTS